VHTCITFIHRLLSVGGEDRMSGWMVYVIVNVQIKDYIYMVRIICSHVLDKKAISFLGSTYVRMQ
jgi:hypothetical protein